MPLSSHQLTLHSPLWSPGWEAFGGSWVMSLWPKVVKPKGRQIRRCYITRAQEGERGVLTPYNQRGYISSWFLFWIFLYLLTRTTGSVMAHREDYVPKSFTTPWSFCIHFPGDQNLDFVQGQGGSPPQVTKRRTAKHLSQENPGKSKPITVLPSSHPTHVIGVGMAMACNSSHWGGVSWEASGNTHTASSLWDDWKATTVFWKWER